MLGRPTLADPEIAAATFRAHFDKLWASGRPDEAGWGRISVDPLTSIVAMPAQRPDGARDWYFLRLGAEYYDAFPVTASFVNPADWADASAGSRWFPSITCPPWIGLHSAYSYPDGQARQLICMTHVAQYYMTDHGPPENTVWQQGRHTVAMTLNRVAEILRPLHYQGPSG